MEFLCGLKSKSSGYEGSSGALPKSPADVVFTSFGPKILEEAPLVPPKESGLVDSCILCLPEAACYALGVKPNINDKGLEKRLWLGRVWQMRALQLKQYRSLLKATHKDQKLSKQAIAELDGILTDPKKKALMLRVQSLWRGSVTRARSRLTCLEPLANDPSSHFGTVLFMHGSGGMTYNNVRYARKLAGMGFVVIAPDSMAGGQYRMRDLAKPITSTQETPYWDDIGLYSSGSKGEYSYSTEAQAVVDNPEKWRELYTNVYRMRRDEMHWILGRLPSHMKKHGVFTMGQSEGAMTVARFDDQRYGEMIRGRIISAFSVEYCYFTPTPDAAMFGGSLDVPTLNIIGDADQYFGNLDSVAKSVSEMKDKGGYGEDVITGNSFKNMKKQQLRCGVVAVLTSAKHDPSETHDNLLRDLLRIFLISPADCHRIPWLLSHCPYLLKKLKVEEEDGEAKQRVLVRFGEMDFPSTLPYHRELVYRQMGSHIIDDKRRKNELFQAKQESDAMEAKAQASATELLSKFKIAPPKLVDPIKTAYSQATSLADMPRKLLKGQIFNDRI